MPIVGILIDAFPYVGLMVPPVVAYVLFFCLD